MGKRTHDGNTKVFWLTECEDITEPSSAEIAAGAELTAQIPSDGLNMTNPRNNASVSMLDAAFTPEEPGTWGVGITLKFTRDDASDAAWDLFSSRGAGFLVISRFGAPAAQSEVEVYPAKNHIPAPLATAENEYQMYEVQLAVTSEPAYNAVVDGEVSA